jgi:hypothetical protein
VTAAVDDGRAFQKWFVNFLRENFACVQERRPHRDSLTAKGTKESSLKTFLVPFGGKENYRRLSSATLPSFCIVGKLSR